MHFSTLDSATSYAKEIFLIGYITEVQTGYRLYEWKSIKYRTEHVILLCFNGNVFIPSLEHKEAFLRLKFLSMKFGAKN